MQKRSKRYQQALKELEQSKSYDLKEAIELVKKTSTTKFDSSVEAHVKLGIDPKQTDQTVRTAVTLPHGTGVKKRIAAFLTAGKEAEAKQAGADIVGGQELIDEIKKTEKIDFDIAVAEPSMMKKLAAIAKILGRIGKMPSPKTGTVTAEIGKAISEIAGGKVEVKNDDSGNIHQIIGKASFDTGKLEENLKVLLEAVKHAKPKGAKQDYIQSVHVASSMGPSVKVKL